MTDRPNRSSSLRLCATVSGILALSTAIPTAAFQAFDATAKSADLTALKAVAALAAAFDFLTLASIAGFAVSSKFHTSGLSLPGRIWTLAIALPALLVAVVGALLTIVALVWKKGEIKSQSQKSLQYTQTFLYAEFALWAMSVIFQGAFYVLSVWHRQRQATSVFNVQDCRRSSLLPGRRDAQPPMTLKNIPSTASHQSPLPSPTPTFSSASSKSGRSWPQAVHQAMQHGVSSRTKLVKARPPRSRSHSATDSLDKLFKSDALDNWDTSSVDSQDRAVVMQSAPSKGTLLETIPQSRPASPGNLLEGPFPSPDRPQTGESDRTITGTYVRPGTSLSSTTSLPTSLSSRPGSPKIDQSNIHPLFRADSPVPPPAATPGTVVMASPNAGQAIPRPYSRARSASQTTSRAGSGAGSRTTSPSPLMKARSFENQSSYPSSVRSSSRHDRDETPPIPEFVLNSSPRGSYVQRSDRRKSEESAQSSQYS